MAFQQHSDRLPPYPGHHFPFHRLFGQQAYRAARPTCRWLTTGQRNDVLPLGRVQQRRRPGTSALVQSPFRAPLLIALAREPHRLRRQPDTGGHLANRLAVGQLSKRQSPQYRSYGLQRLCRNPAAAMRLAKFSHLHPGLAPRAHFNAAAARLFRPWCGVLLHRRTALPVATQALQPPVHRS